jgi:ubiquitin C-terminal hydrolase
MVHAVVAMNSWQGAMAMLHTQRVASILTGHSRHYTAMLQGTKVEGVINKLFEGRILKFIECLNVDYKSTKRDDYMDIFLDVKGCKNVYESFDRLTAEERLEGDNQYNAEGHGMQVCGSCVRAKCRHAWHVGGNCVQTAWD